MRKLILLLLASCLLLAEGIHWEKDYGAAVAKASEQHKPLFFVFSRHACKWCRHLEKTTFEDPKVISELNSRFVNVIAYEDGGDFVPRALWAPGTPALWFLDEQGEAMFQPIQGSVGAADFLQATGIVLDEYKKIQLSKRYGKQAK